MSDFFVIAIVTLPVTFCFLTSVLHSYLEHFVCQRITNLGVPANH
jgi:uncharacterized membrane protein